MTRFPYYLSFLSALALTFTACTTDETPADETSTSDEDSATETGTGDGDGDPATGDGDGDASGDGDGDGDGPVCGNGDLEFGEECDDGNDVEGDGCSATCTVTSCGLQWSTRQDIESSTNGGFDVAVGPDGSVYTTGIIVNETNDVWAAKWSPEGELVWSESFDSGAGNDAGLAIALDGDRLYIGGWYAGDGEELWYASLNEATGAEEWSVLVPGMFEGEDDLVTGLEVDGNGDLILSGRVRAGDGDDDIWIRKASATDGSEIWTTTWSGAGNGAFSIERGGPIAASPDGTYWAAVREYVDNAIQEATLLHIDADGNVVATYQPQGGGGEHTHDVIAVAAAEDGVYFAFADYDFPFKGWLYKLNTDGSEQWVKTEQDWLTVGNDWQVRGLGLDDAGNLSILGVFDNEDPDEGIDWGQPWSAKLDGAGEVLCRSEHMIDDGAFLPPSLSLDGAGASAGGMAITGIETPNQSNAVKLWTGYFMP